MPNNCSTLIQRKQNILHKILRSNSDGKLQNAVAETTAELCVAGTRKTPAYSSPSSHHLAGAAAAVATSASNARRSNLFVNNRIQPSSNHLYDTHLPSIRDTNGHVDRHNQMYDKSYSRPKTPVTNTSPKSVGRPPSTSISSIFNALAKRSSENFMSTYGDYEETINPNPVPPSRRSQRPYKGNGINQNATKQTVLSQKQSGDSGIDIHFPTGSADANQQQRALAMASGLRTNAPQVHVEAPLVQEITTKERTNFGPLYQRRQNNSVKAPTKQKIDKYRRRSEEVTQATNGVTQTNNGLTTTTPSPTTRSKPPLSPAAAAAVVRRVSSDGEIQAHLEVLRLSMDTNLIQTDHQVQSQSHQHARNRVKSPYLYTNHHQTKPATPTSSPQTPPVHFRRSHGPTQPASSVNSSQHPHTNNTNNRRSQQQQNSVKQSVTPSPGNLYLAFIASRHLSSLEDALFECDIDHQKLLRIFTWLKGVEDHRREQSNHDKLLIEQNQRILDQEENLSLYSEIQHAVDDLPPNTTGKPCEKIVTMQFED